LTEENFVGNKTSELSIPKPLPVGDDDVHNNNNSSNTDVEVTASEIVNERTGQEKGDDGEEERFVLIPVPGLPSGALLDFLMNSSNYSSNNNLQSSIHSSSNHRMLTTSTLREVPIECSICLCEYTVGSDVVWSSNPQCEHVFHKNCIEQWLMKQREGPLCPCCRRDFVIDPFDDAEALIEAMPTDIIEESAIEENDTIQTTDPDAMSDERAERTDDIDNGRTLTV
jgi:hypothetical protein